MIHIPMIVLGAVVVVVAVFQLGYTTGHKHGYERGYSDGDHVGFLRGVQAIQDQFIKGGKV